MRCGEKASRGDRFFACMHFLVIWMIERIMRVQKTTGPTNLLRRPNPSRAVPEIFPESEDLTIRRSKIVAEPAFPCFPSHKKFLHGDRPIMTSALSLKPDKRRSFTQPGHSLQIRQVAAIGCNEIQS